MDSRNEQKTAFKSQGFLSAPLVLHILWWKGVWSRKKRN